MYKSMIHSSKMRLSQRLLRDGSKMVALINMLYMQLYSEIKLWLHSFIVYINSISVILTKRDK